MVLLLYQALQGTTTALVTVQRSHFSQDHLHLHAWGSNHFAKPANLAATLTQGNGTIATLTWTQNGTANTWQLQTATDADFTSNVQNYICTTTTKDLTGLTAEPLTTHACAQTAPAAT